MLLPEGLEHGVDATVVVVRVVARGAEHRAAEVQRAAHVVRRQGDHVAVDDAAPAVAETHEGVAVQGALLDHCSDQGVEPWAVSASGEDAYAHASTLRRSCGRRIRAVEVETSVTIACLPTGSAPRVPAGICCGRRRA